MKRSETFKKLWDRWKYAVLVAAIGVVLLLIPFGDQQSETIGAADAAVEDAQTQATQTEARMETILAKINGTGELHLMLTVDTGTEQRLARNEELSYSGDSAAPNDYSRTTETVLSGGSGTNAPVVTQTRCPTWRGALVVCQGGGDAQVKLAVTQAVCALTGLGADRITVAKCQ